MRILSALSSGIVAAALLFAGSLVASSGSAVAQATPLPKTAPKLNVDARLISEKLALKPGATAWFALHMKIAKGWHVYWKNPGDSGEAPVIEWKFPAGYKSGALLFQPPHRLPVGPLMNYGYSNEAVYLVPVTVPADARAGTPVTLTANASWLVCEEICVPEAKTFTLTLDVMAGDPPADFRHADLFAKARAGLPKPSPWTARFASDKGGFVLRLDARGMERARLREAYFYPATFGVISYPAPQKLSVGADGITLWTEASKKPIAAKSIDGVLVLTEKLEDGGTATQAFAVKAAADPALAAAAAAGRTGDGAGGGGGTGDIAIGFLLALGLALIGGVILNVMPCVFPVLSMKLVGLAQHAHADRRTLAGHGMAYAAGVVLFFALVGAALAALRATGQEIGWGFQLQEPVVVLLLGLVLFAVGLNLSGLYQIGGSFMNVGAGLAGRKGYSGTFFTGALAVLVASPCTVPFMSGAVGYAAFAAWYEALAIMVFLGIGMALPFLLLCLFPGSLRRLPKPGPWMDRLKQVLAFPMYGMAAWLLWVATLQAGEVALLAGLAGALLLAFALWLWQSTRNVSARGRAFGSGFAVLFLVAAVGLIVVADRPAAAPKVASAESGAWKWSAFSPEKLQALRAEGKPVFVNFTAAWCITCIVNERATLRSETLLKAMKARGIAILKADWTRRDATIARELARFGRNGVPLYVFYPPAGSAAKPVVMPQILTESGMMDEIRKFKPTKQAARTN